MTDWRWASGKKVIMKKRGDLVKDALPEFLRLLDGTDDVGRVEALNIIKNRWCVYCGAADATDNCECHGIR